MIHWSIYLMVFMTILAMTYIFKKLVGLIISFFGFMINHGIIDPQEVIATATLPQDLKQILRRYTADISDLVIWGIILIVMLTVGMFLILNQVIK